MVFTLLAVDRYTNVMAHIEENTVNHVLSQTYLNERPFCTSKALPEDHGVCFV